MPIAAAGAVAAGALLLLAGPRMGAEPGGTALDTSYPETADKLRAYAEEIDRQRSTDAFYHQKFLEASKRRLDAALALADAEKAAVEQERIWNATHRNQDQFTAATVKVDSLRAERDAAAAEADQNRAYVDQAAQTIVSYRQSAMGLISTLPAEFQGDARRIIDPCYKSPGMRGAAMGGPSRFEGVSAEEYAARTGHRGIPARAIGLFY